jgi:CRP/FNR family transcriptional regulator, cyclic AMP receptor protein
VRLRKSTKESLIKAVPLFARCTRRELAALAARADELSVPAGQELTRQGARGREFMVIVDGAAKVKRNGRTVSELGPGDFVGEIALLSGSPRTATVVTTTPADLLVITDRAFNEVVKAIPSVRASLLAALSERLHGDAL